MPTSGSYTFKLAKTAVNGLVADENTIEKGEWGWIDKSLSSRWLSIYMRCPDCGFLSTLWRSYGDEAKGHQIDKQGNVSPSVGCQHTLYGATCGYHTQPTLLEGFIDRR